MADPDLELIRGTINELQSGFTKLTSAAGGASSAISGMAGAISKGTVGLDTYSNLLNEANKGVGAFAKNIPLAGNAVAGGLNLMTATMGKTLETTDRLNRTYSASASQGTALGESLKDMADRGAKFGLAIGLNEQQAQIYAKTMQANSQSLARLGGTAQAGAKRFEDTFEATGKFRIGLQNLGVSYEEQIEGVGDYLKIQTQLGQAQRMSTDQLANGAKNYLVELQGLAQITGQNRAEMQKQRESALSEQKFRASYELQLRKAAQLEAQGRTEEAAAIKKAANGLLTLDNIVASSDKELAKGLRDLSTGMVNSPEAKKAIMATGGQGQQIMQQLKQGVIGPVEAADKLSKAVGKTTDRMLPLAAASDNYAQTFGNLSDQLKFSQLSQNEIRKQAIEVEKRQMKTAGDVASEQSRANAASNKARFVGIAAQDAVVSMQDAALGAANKIGDLAIEYIPQLTEEFKKLTKEVTNVVTTSKSLEDAMKRLGNLAVGKAADVVGPAPKPGSPEDKGVGAAVDRVIRDVTGVLGGKTKPTTPEAKPQESPKGQQPGTQTAPGGAQTAPPQPMVQQPNLEGLNIKPGAVAAGNIDAKLIEAARQIQKQIPNARFTSLNDPVAGRSAKSAHNQGKAVDIVVAPEQVEELKALLKQLGAKTVIDEMQKPANPKAAKSWAPHIHAEFAKGGIAQGPMSGYPALLHGMEAIVPLPNNKKIPVEIKSPQLPMPSVTGIGDTNLQVGALEKGFSSIADNLKKSFGESGGDMTPLVGLLTELVQQQKNANTTMNKLLQVSRN
jgi:hypothetical protein